MPIQQVLYPIWKIPIGTEAEIAGKFYNILEGYARQKTPTSTGRPGRL